MGESNNANSRFPSPVKPKPGMVLLLLGVLGLGILATPPGYAAQPSDPLGQGKPSDPFAEDPFDTPAVEDSERIPLPDPIEPWNRFFFQFNDRFYFLIAKPASEQYKDLTTREIRRGIKNFFGNLQEPVSLVNALLQGRPGDAHDALSRFLMNTVFGLGGLFDPAAAYHPSPDRTFDQTLAKAGVDPGFYVVWPILGPSSTRGTVGLSADAVLYPPNYLGAEVAIGSVTLKRLNEVTLRGSYYEIIRQYSLDPYVALKHIYETHLYREHGR